MILAPGLLHDSLKQFVDPDKASECRAALDAWMGQCREVLARSGVATVRADQLTRTVFASLEAALIMARSQHDAKVVKVLATPCKVPFSAI